MKAAITFIFALLLALGGFCAWKWSGDNSLRATTTGQSEQLADLTAKHGVLEARLQAAESEVTRLTSELNDLRGHSVSNAVHMEVLKTNAALRDTAAKQSATISEQNELLAKQNAALKQANDSLKKLSAQPTDLARRPIAEAAAAQEKPTPPAAPATPKTAAKKKKK